MKKFGSRIIYGKDAKISMVLALAALAFVVLGCGGGGKTTSKPLPATYFGSWSASDGSTLTLTSNGTGSYKSGGTTIDGAAAELDETGKTLKLSFLGVAVKEFKIDKEPSGGSMKLDGIVYQTAGGDKGTPSPNDSPVASDDPDMPSSTELNDMVKTTILDFNSAIQQEDFTDFRNNVSKDFKNQFTADKMKQAFDQFVKNKDEAGPIFSSVSTKTPNYSPAPNITKEKGHKLLNLKGTYDTSDTTKFDLQYVLEDGDWKLLKIRVEVG